MNINEFEEKLLTSFKNFVNTIRGHVEVGKREDLTYADWFDTFRAHEEVGNEMELEYHGPRVLSVHGPVCQLCAESLKTNPENSTTSLVSSPSTCVDCREKFWTSTPGRDICAACYAHRVQEECEQ